MEMMTDMKKFRYIFMLLILFLTGCSGDKVANTTFSSSLLNDEGTYNELITSSALFAYEVKTTDESTFQTIYVWNNLLRRELRLDLKQFITQLDHSNEKVYSISFDETLKINNKKLDYTPSSELSKYVVNLLLPHSFNANQSTLYWNFACLSTSLETYESWGVTEVVMLKTTTSIDMILNSTDSIELVDSIE